ncbi:cytochrome P450-like protein [Fonsecaea pedrosoi]|nr:cytochrome P450-like protein [Fonsecaea pedrosoi]
MMDSLRPHLTAKTAVVVLVVIVIATLLRNYRNKGLCKYPGPFLANFTDAWRFFSVLRGKSQLTLRTLHDQHGHIVRLGPNSLSFSSPEALKSIYGLNNRLMKSAFYPVQMQLARGEVLQSLFGTQDQDYHARLRRTVSNAFSMTSIVQYEPRVNDTVRVFLERTQELYAKPGVQCDFLHWLQYFAFDVITEITYSRRAGFVDRCEDVDGIIAWLDKIFDYQAPVGQMPWLDKLFVKNPVRALLSKHGFTDNSSGTAKFSRARMAERLSGAYQNDSMDLLTMFLQAQKEHADFFDDGRLLTMTTSIALAGSDTTAITLAAIFYFLARYPKCYQKLDEEIEDAIKTGLISDTEGIITWSDAQKLPYLHACIQETFRMHPAIGMILERVVPPQGMEICGEFIPGGTIVGCNPWVLQRQPDFFGHDVDIWRPERWLINPTAAADSEEQRLKRMNSAMFQFGGGTRTCLGKHIALLEIYKLVPSFLRRFEIQPTDDEEWDLHTAWFVKPRKFDVVITAKETCLPER